MTSARQSATLYREGVELDDLLANLRAAGVEVVTKPEWDDAGLSRFARLHDPEGNPIELWEPAD